ncbi:hypothetical protein [Streptomyces fradiae]
MEGAVRYGGRGPSIRDTFVAAPRSGPRKRQR